MAVESIDVLQDLAEEPWRRGVNDCFVAAADQVKAWFGVDPMARYRGRYTSLTGYLRIIRKDGYADAREAFRGELERAGFVPTVGARLDGDVALASYREDGRQAVAPALYFSGFWHLRSKAGWVCLDGMDGIGEVFRWVSK